MVTVIDEIAAERRRQIEGEKFATELDDGYVHGELARAAVCYAWFASATDKNRDGPHRRSPPAIWPETWSHRWWKPKDRRRDLIRAAALIVAEIERLDRSAASLPRKEEG